MNVQDRIDQAAAMVTKRSKWDTQYQLLAELIFQTKSSFQTQYEEGEFLNDGEITESTGALALQTMCAALLGLLWPSSGRSIRAQAPYYLDPENEKIKQYYDFFTRQLAHFLDRPRARMIPTLGEYMLEEGAFGTSGIGVFGNDDYADPLLFKSFSLTGLYICEGKNGDIDTIIYKQKYEVKRLVADYGIENVHTNVRKLYESKQYSDKVDVLLTLMPRMNPDKNDKTALGMPIALYVDDQTNKHQMLESGYSEMPIRVPRFTKLPNETYGRCPAMSAVPTMLEANRVSEAYREAVEKKPAPPLMQLNDGSLGPEEIDTSANAINVFSVTNRIQSSIPPLSPIYEVGELQTTEMFITRLQQQILSHFLVDRLLDLNSKTRMTLGEANIRMGIRNDALTTILARQNIECYVPLIENAVTILFDMGLLGVIAGSMQEAELIRRGISPTYIPEEVQKAIMAGLDFYEIKFISPAARMLRDEEVQSMSMVVAQAGQLAQVQPEIMDVVDGETYLRVLREVQNADPMILNSKEKVGLIRHSRAAMQAEQMKAAIEQKQAVSAQAAGQAASSFATAQQTATQGGGM